MEVAATFIKSGLPVQGRIDGGRAGDRVRLMRREVAEVAESAAKILRQQLRAEEVWLFGSQVRETSGPDSDLDFMVVVPATSEPRYQREQKAHTALRNLPMPRMWWC